MCAYLRTKFQVFSILLTSYRHGGEAAGARGVNFTHPPTPQNEPLKSPPRLGLKFSNVGNNETGFRIKMQKYENTILRNYS